MEGALEGFVFDVFEARLQRVEQFAILGAGHVGDAVPEVRRLDDVMHLAAHLLFEFRNPLPLRFSTLRASGSSGTEVRAEAGREDDASKHCSAGDSRSRRPRGQSLRYRPQT